MSDFNRASLRTSACKAICRKHNEVCELGRQGFVEHEIRGYAGHRAIVHKHGDHEFETRDRRRVETVIPLYPSEDSTLEENNNG